MRIMMAAITPMTIPAIAPPESPLLLPLAIIVPLPVLEAAMGVWKGTVVVGEMVCVVIIPEMVVGRTGATAPTPVVVKPPAPADLQTPELVS